MSLLEVCEVMVWILGVVIIIALEELACSFELVELLLTELALDDWVVEVGAGSPEESTHVTF